MKTKECPSCLACLPLADFYVERLRKDGSPMYRRECRRCFKERVRRYVEDNPEKRKANARAYYHRLRLLCLQRYSGKEIICACCGEKTVEFLTIDHVNNNGAEHRRLIGGSRAVYGWLKKNGFPDGFQVLCFNCNCAKSNYGICPHKCKAGDPLAAAVGRIGDGKLEGELSPKAKLTEEKVRSIVARYQQEDVTYGELGAEFGVSLSTVRAIIQGHNWKHLGLVIAPEIRKERVRTRVSGSANGNAKLTAAQVCSIRQKHAAGGTTLKQLAGEYGVHIATVWRIINRGR